MAKDIKTGKYKSTKFHNKVLALRHVHVFYVLGREDKKEARMDKQWSHTYSGSFRLIKEQWIQIPSYSKHSLTKPVSYTVNEAL